MKDLNTHLSLNRHKFEEKYSESVYYIEKQWTWVNGGIYNLYLKFIECIMFSNKHGTFIKFYQ